MKPDIEPMFTMEPDFASSMCLPKARQHQNVPLRLTSMTLSQCSSATFSAGVSPHAIRSCPDYRAVLVDAVQPSWIRRKPYAVASPLIEISDAAHRQQTELARVDIEDGVAAQMLCDRHSPGPALAFLANLQMLGP